MRNMKSKAIMGGIAVAFVIVMLLYINSIKLGRVVSGSMEPALSVGDIVRIKECDIEKIKEGDIIVYESTEGKKIIHRVVLCTENGLLVKGDSNRYMDEEIVTSDNLVGKVTTIMLKTRAEGKKHWTC